MPKYNKCFKCKEKDMLSTKIVDKRVTVYCTACGEEQKIMTLKYCTEVLMKDK